MNWKWLLLFIAAAWALQGLLTSWQMRNFRRRFAELSRNATDGYLGVGSSAGRIRAGAVVLIVTDTEGTITQAECMTGRTVFARFEPLPEVVGMNVDQLGSGAPAVLAEMPKNPRQAAVMAAELVQKKMGEDEAASRE